MFHNDGQNLYVFPDVWKAMYDFMKYKEQFILPSSQGRMRAIGPWARGVGGPLYYHYQGNDKYGKAHIVLEGQDWKPVHVYLKVNRSHKVYISHGSPSVARPS